MTLCFESVSDLAIGTCHRRVSVGEHAHVSLCTSGGKASECKCAHCAGHPVSASSIGCPECDVSHRVRLCIRRVRLHKQAACANALSMCRISGLDPILPFIQMSKRYSKKGIFYLLFLHFLIFLEISSFFINIPAIFQSNVINPRVSLMVARVLL